MKVAQLVKYGGTEAIVFNPNAPPPTLTEGSILVEVEAAGVNPFDWKMREGMMQKMIPLTFPVTAGADFSGVVSEVGGGVSNYKKGDEVYGQASILDGNSGAFAEMVVVGLNTIVHKPKSITHVEAAALPLVGVSAIQALIEHMKLTRGQRILIHGGAGGIGSIAIQIGKHLGAYVVTTVSKEDAEYVKSLGADQTIDYKSEHFETILKDFDAVYDTVGGEINTRSYQVLKKGGILVSMLEQPKPELVKQYGITYIAQQTKVTSEKLTELARLVDEKVIKVHVDKIFPLEKAGEALSYLEDGLARGKVVVEIKKVQ